jgi:hypothetical protein
MATSARQTADVRLAMSALEKQRRGEQPTRDETAALRRYEKQIEDQRRDEHYRTIPKKLWRLWSGRQAKIILEQADRYGFEMLRGATIDLPAFVKRFHDWLAENARKLSAADSVDPTLAGVASPALEKKRQLECQRVELLLNREQGLWIERRLIHEGHNRMGAILRTAGEALLRQFGPAAQKIINDALQNCERETDRLLAADDDTDFDQCGAG